MTLTHQTWTAFGFSCELTGQVTRSSSEYKNYLNLARNYGYDKGTANLVLTTSTKNAGVTLTTINGTVTS